MNVETLEKYLPAYLNSDSKNSLLKFLNSDFDKNLTSSEVYLTETKDYFMQGDIFLNIPFLRITEKEPLISDALMISNTCDVDRNNVRKTQEINFNFIQIFRLRETIEGLKKKNISSDSIRSFENDIRKNQISNCFYLPACKSESGHIQFEESYACFDKTSCYSPNFIYKNYKDHETKQRRRAISLTNYGFYLLIVKMSIHFCRLKEGDIRSF